MNTWKPILAALVIFAAGVVTGGLTVNLRKQPAAKKPVAMPREGQLRELSRRMQAELDLTPEQRERIEAIIHDSQERVKMLRDEIGQKEFREMRQKIRSELTPEQRKKFAEIMQRHDERNKRDERTGRPSPPPAEKTE